MKSRFSTWVATAVQLALGIGIIGFILYRLHDSGNLGTLRDALLTSAGHWPLLVAGAFCFPLCLYACAVRWHLLLKAQNLHTSFARIHALNYVGHFFNAFLLGATGGDVAKAYYATVETTDKKTEAVATVFIDRLVGLLALIGLCAVIGVFRWSFFMSSETTRVALVFTGILTLGAAGLVAALALKPWLDGKSFFTWITRRSPAGNILNRAYEACHLCLKNRRIVIQVTVLSLINHLAFVVCSYLYGRAIGLDLTLLDQLTIFPLINMIAAIPVTPSGIGTRDAAAIVLLAPFGVEEGAAVTLSLMIYATLILWSLVGGAVYLMMAHRLGKPGRRTA